MIWILAAAPAVLVGLLLFALGSLYPAILAYHALCAIAIIGQRRRIKTLFQWDRRTLLWTLGIAGSVILVLVLAPWVYEPSSFRQLFRQTLFPRGDPGFLFLIFAGYSMIVHVPLEEVFWRGVVLDPGRDALHLAVARNALFFGLLHAVPLWLLLGPRGMLLAGPAFAAGAGWAFVAIRTRSLWPGLVSHWGADAVILAEMWFYFIR